MFVYDEGLCNNQHMKKKTHSIKWDHYCFLAAIKKLFFLFYLGHS